MTPTVSIVIPTHNNRKLLLDCLRSLRRLTYPASNLETVVVDNASTDGTQASLKSAFSQVSHVRLETNTGFAAACNHGAAEASGEYVAFLNDDAMPHRGWLEALLAALDAGGPDAACAASRILSRDGSQVEYDGGTANLFGVGRPRAVSGWADAPSVQAGDPVLFASGGAMLIHRRAFLDVGGFDPAYFAYFEDVDLGWRLWLLGHKVVYAPDAVVTHIGGATGSRSGIHRRQTLWECNSLATILKNYEGGNMERILTAALMLLYKRALLSAGDAVRPAEYALTAPKDTNTANVERVPKLSVAHLAAIDRFNANLPHFMAERERIQKARVRTDAEILPLLGRLWEPQFAGQEYAEAAREVARTLRLLDLSPGDQPRVLIVALAHDEEQPVATSSMLHSHCDVALALVGDEPATSYTSTDPPFPLHRLTPDSPQLRDLVKMAERVIAIGEAANLPAVRESGAQLAVIGAQGMSIPPGAFHVQAPAEQRLVEFCKSPAGTTSY